MSVPYETRARWAWPDTGEATTGPEDFQAPGSFKEDEEEEPKVKQESPAGEEAQTEGIPPPRRPQQHYGPRTCRICLEEVNPTFEDLGAGFPSVLQPAPKVSYVSSDPTLGRLIRPCKCRGSQKYVHEGCLRAWRHADPAYGRRNFWECPTCKFRYRLERLRWSRYISGTFMQIVITVAIMLLTIFVFGFIADPIINLYLDPLDTITSIPSGGPPGFQLDDEGASWGFHFLKGLTSLGLIGFVKVFFTMSPFHWWNIRVGGGRRRRGGRERLEDISWTVVLIGIITFLAAVWTWVRAWTARTLERAGERVADVQGEEDDTEEPN